MSTIEHTAGITFAKITLGRRISELMLERGDAFSIRAFAERVGMNRETFRKTLLGERPVTISLVENVSNGLGITEERLRQLDTFKKEQEVAVLLGSSQRSKIMMLRAQTLARELADVALGFTERCVCWANLGRSQYYLQQYDLAHESFLTAMQYAEKVNEAFDDSTLLYHVTSYLMISYTIRREYTNIVQTLNVVEKAFSEDPEKMGYVHYTRMKWNEHRGNLEQAKVDAYVALEHFEKTENKSQIGKAQNNVAHFEYLTGNFQKAKEQWFEAMGNLEPFEYPYLSAVKDYVKVLLQMGDKSTASEILTANFDRAKEYPNFAGIFQILFSVALDDPSYAMTVSEDLSMSLGIRNMACECLMDYYATNGDADSVMRYYKRVRALKKQNTFFEEGF